MVRLALVDVDGTLLRGQSYPLVFRELWARGWHRLRLLSLLSSKLPYHALRKLGVADRLRNQERWAEGMAWLLAGATVSEVQRLLRAVCSRIEPVLRPGLLRELAKHRESGYRVVLASTVIEPLLQELAAVVQADAWVGTPLAVKEGRYTGRLAGPPCNGHRKLQYVEDLVNRWGENVDWARCYAYSDSVTDLPVLERVGYPVAVAPDRRLAAIAHRRSWRVMD